MSSADFDEAARRDYRAPYSTNHPIPTIQRYREHRDEFQGQQDQAEAAQHTEEDDSRGKRAFSAVKAIVKNEDKKDAAGEAYPTSNQNIEDAGRAPGEKDSTIPAVTSASDNKGQTDGQDDDNGSAEQNGKPNGQEKKNLSATEKVHRHTDPKQKRKEMKHNKREDGGREVTDPVTHLPLVIRDSTAKDLRRAPENQPAPGQQKRTDTGSSMTSKSSSRLSLEQQELQQNYDGMMKLFPPPAYDDARIELAKTFQHALTLSLSIILALSMTIILLLVILGFRSNNLPGSSAWTQKTTEHGYARYIIPGIITAIASVIGFLVIMQIRGWLENKVKGIWEDEVWDAARVEQEKSNQSNERLPESVAWMNSLLSSVWPLINPDLFASVIDMLEDVMQASLPKVIRMVSVDDLGQGSEAIRILGIRWLPTGAADKSVDEEGNLKHTSNKEANDRGAPGQGEEEDLEKKQKDEEETDASKKKKEEKEQKEQEQKSIREGMEAEQGDFVNLELAFAYRARSSGKSIKSKARNAHLYLKFYLSGGISIPVWVELRGLIGTMRVRLQLTPDPPFFSLCTLTFLGQPRADLSCTPLSKHLPNLMNVPLISSFVQSAIDAALAEYVAPKSLTLDLKDMLVGDDFKKDTVTRGVLLVYIKEAKGFKEGDGSIGPMGGSSDAYVTCSWGKFGKTISSTRIIEKNQHPKWHEWAYMLVSPEELNAEEKLRIQLWDSDKFTADDDLGRVEVDLKELMYSPKTKNKQYDREDRFRGQEPEEKMPGTISWSVGYYAKTRITEDQLASQTEDENIKTKEDLKKQVSETAQRKLREATARDESKEIHQQRTQDYQERENALICSSPPDPKYPSGVLSIQIHNITGLEVESLQKKDNDGGDQEDGAELSDNLPSSYCTIILNHKKIYMTRTKPKNAKPFFNAGTEHLVRDWQTAEVMVSVRDSRERENDALLGIIYLPLAKVFEKRSQIMDMYPLVGGMGFGRARVSMVFRSIELQLPKEQIGWDYGTLEIKSPVRPKTNLSQDLIHHRIKLRSNIGRVKMQSNDGLWRSSDGESSFLACRNRYAMPLIIEFRTSSLVHDSTPAFAVFWLREIPDEENRTITMQVWKGGKENIKQATTCACYQGLDDGEQPLGEIEVVMKFWRGLSGYHKKFAQKDKNEDMRSVMEVLDTVNDEIKDDDAVDEYSDMSDSSSSSGSEDENSKQRTSNSRSPTNKKIATHTNQDSSGSEDEASSSKNPFKKLKKVATHALEGHNDEDDSSRGVVEQVRDYKDHHRQLHRRHRGVMQWRAARTGDWALNKARKGLGGLEGVFEHGEKGGKGVETEV